MTSARSSMTLYPQTWTQPLLREAGIAAALVGLTALAARIAIPLPWTPVPATLQVAAVIFAGASCGPWRGALSQVIYLLLGLAGAPVFAPGADSAFGLLAPTLGYLAAFPIAAFLAGRWVSPAGRLIGGALALGCVYLCGVGWLIAAAWLGGHPSPLGFGLLSGLLPFLPFDLLKTALAVWSASPIRQRIFS